MSEEPWRHEVKLACPGDAGSLALARSWVRGHPASFGAAHPPRRVNSIYFDTQTWSNLEDHLAGIADRAKLRLRWYGNSVCAVHGQLELKEKRGSLSRKIRCPLESTIDLTSMSWRSVLRVVRAGELGPLAPHLSVCCCPKLLSTYRREYYVSADGSVRLTLDTDLRAYDQALSSHPNLTRRTPDAPVVIMEFKAAGQEQRRLTQIVSGLPIRATAYSKYVARVLPGGRPVAVP